MLSRRSIRAVVLLIGLLLLFSACREANDEPTPTPTQEPTAIPGQTPEPAIEVTPTVAEPEDGGTLIVGLPREPDSLNFSLTEVPASWWVISTLNARMIGIDNEGQYQPQLLEYVPSQENGGISSGGQSWTLQFRENLTWSDGETLDGQDFLFTWETLTSPDYPSGPYPVWELINSVTLSDDDLTVTVRLSTPSAQFLDSLLAGASDDGQGFLLPAHLFEDMSPTEIARSAYGGDEHVGSGPFVLSSWETGDQMIVERNEQFYGTGSRLDRIVFRFIPDVSDTVAYLGTGEIDLAVALPETSLVELAPMPDVTVRQTPIAGAVEMYAFNLNDPSDLTAPHPILSDPDVRLAIALAFDRESLVESLMLEQTSVASSPLDNSRWAPEDLEPHPFDPERAREILDEAGWQLQENGIRERDGMPLRLNHTTVLADDPEAALRQRVQAAFIDNMEDVGIDIQAQNITPDQIGDGLSPQGLRAQRQFDIVNINAERSGVDILRWRFHSDYIPDEEDPGGGNITGFQDFAVDRLLAEQAFEMDTDLRFDMVAEVLEIIHQSVPVLPLYDHLDITAHRDYVLGIEPGSRSGTWWNVEEWWVDREGVLP